MNQSLRDKRMSEYTITNKYTDEGEFDKKEFEAKFSNWIEDMINKYPDVDKLST